MSDLHYVAFLRAINVGGRVVAMDVLKREFMALGFTGVETFIASGNVMFSSPSADTDKLARRIENRLKASLGYEVDTFIRTIEEVVKVARYAPFPAVRPSAVAVLNVGFLSAPPPRSAHADLKKLETPIDAFHLNGREVYWLRKDKPSESKISYAVLERALQMRSTFRGINTVVRLSAKLADKNLSRRSAKGVDLSRRSPKGEGG